MREVCAYVSLNKQLRISFLYFAAHTQKWFQKLAFFSVCLARLWWKQPKGLGNNSNITLISSQDSKTLHFIRSTEELVVEVGWHTLYFPNCSFCNISNHCARAINTLNKTTAAVTDGPAFHHHCIAPASFQDNYRVKDTLLTWETGA